MKLIATHREKRGLKKKDSLSGFKTRGRVLDMGYKTHHDLEGGKFGTMFIR